MKEYDFRGQVITKQEFLNGVYTKVEAPLESWGWWLLDALFISLIGYALGAGIRALFF